MARKVGRIMLGVAAAGVLGVGLYALGSQGVKAEAYNRKLQREYSKLGVRSHTRFFADAHINYRDIISSSNKELSRNERDALAKGLLAPSFVAIEKKAKELNVHPGAVIDVIHDYDMTQPLTTLKKKAEKDWEYSKGTDPSVVIAGDGPIPSTLPREYTLPVDKKMEIFTFYKNNEKLLQVFKQAKKRKPTITYFTEGYQARKYAD